MKALFRVGFVLVFVFCFQSRAISQQELAPQPARIDNKRLALNVVVTDKSGKPIQGLTAQDFTVLDNKQPTKILTFRPPAPRPADPSLVDVSAEIILVLDEVNAPFSKVTDGRDEIIKFLKQNNGQLSYPVSLAFLTEKGMQMQTQPTDDGNALAAALAQKQQALRVLTENTGFHGDQLRLKISQDALRSLIAQENAKPGKKLVIWVSPGWPLLSSGNVDLSESQREHTYETVVELSNGLRQANITMDSIDPMGSSGMERTMFYQNFTKPLTRASQAEFGDISLQVLATQTGGRVIFGADPILNSLNHCIADIGATYKLSIEMGHAGEPNQFHELQVKVLNQGAKVRTRNGYYEQH